ncbi:hypothetical protein PybrP1_013184 [[Pythium] brassicae (nom. inval.)]|nr:hypothetical protein PybrP1_013184 [[Pythium] brassicae (nom. inval.)]
MSVSAQLFVAMQSKSAQWYEKEREGIALIEGFETALNACRAELDASAPAVAAAGSAASSGNGGARFSLASLSGLGGNSQMDPLLAEELFAQVKALKSGFAGLLQDMCDLQLRARQAVLDASRASSEKAVEPLPLPALAPIDYYQFIGHELAAYEAEYQHVEALLDMISFTITTDQLRTLVISWSTSPFLDPEQSRAFRKRHELATSGAAA